MTELTRDLLVERLQVLRQRIETAGGDLDLTTILAVTKTFPIEVSRLAVDVGLVDLGENYAQELEAKGPTLDRPEARWHFIGSLQRNKVKKIAAWVTTWQTVDRLAVAEEIAKRAPGARMMVQVNTTDEAQKSGCPSGETAALVEHSRSLGLDVCGLLTIGPTDGSDPSPGFAMLRQLGERLEVPELSMGMTGDLELAVKEGSTMVRVGTALFGHRTPRVAS